MSFCRKSWFQFVCLAVLFSVVAGRTVLAGQAYKANPKTLRSALSRLKAGDTLNLVPGNYTSGMSLSGLRGKPNAWITIQGPASGAPAVFVGRNRRNTINIRSCSYVAFKNLTLDGKGLSGIDGFKARTVSSKSPTHHIWIEGCTIKNHNGSQNTVGISTKTSTWGWIIRRNRVINAGTGLYLGNSDGHQPFVNGLIEYNLVKDPVGYCMQIKYQKNRPKIKGMPEGPCTTIIRHNVFIKDDRRSPSGNRPNLLVGNFPDSGPGSQDRYEIYGNLLVHNPRESLLQVAGGVTIHDNIFVDVAGNAIRVQSNRKHPVKHTSIYNNTIYAARTAVSVGDRASVAEFMGNLVFAKTLTRGKVVKAKSNIFAPVGKASEYVNKPGKKPGQIDLYPLAGKCAVQPLDLSAFKKETEYDLDFNGKSKGTFTTAGAYAGSGKNPGWPLEADNKAAVPAKP